jgi:hypothetical protein
MLLQNFYISVYHLESVGFKTALLQNRYVGHIFRPLLFMFNREVLNRTTIRLNGSKNLARSIVLRNERLNPIAS